MGSGKKVWSVQAAIRHMDRHPEDGIYHLRNGTLARWLDEQGARHLAELAREVVRRRETDPRILLETFLIGTGLVPRPRLSIKPRRLDFGYLLTGQTGTTTLRIRKARGRGYLFGVLQTSVPWLRVEPRTFSGRPLEALVRVNTEALPIRGRPHEAKIYVESSASERPIEIPVRLRVVGRPSPLNRYLFRPLVGLVSAGVLGAALGWLGWLWTRPDPLAIDSSQLASGYLWSGLLGCLWAALGGIRGGLQPLAWPIMYATRRWLWQVFVWMIVFFSLAGVTLLAWERAHPEMDPYTLNIVRAGSWFLASLLIAVFATLSGVWRRPTRHGRERIARRLWLRGALLILCGVLLGGALAFGARAFGPTWQRLDTARWITSARIQAEDQWIRLESEINTLIDRVYLLYYDRRAPARPAVEPSPQATRPTEEAAP